jgi:hypothetical protein
MRAMKRLAMVVLAACGGGGDSGEPPLAEVEAPLGMLAVNDTSIFAVDTMTNAVVELSIVDGAMIGKLPSNGVVSDLVATGKWVAWIEPEGSGKLMRRRKIDGTSFESMRATTTEPKILASSEGLIYSDGTLVALWLEGANPDRLATTGAGARVIGADASFVYTAEMDTSVLKYPRSGDAAEMVLPQSKDATVKDGQIAFRTAEGIRMIDLTSGFNRVVGAPPTDYPCTLLIAGRAVICGKYRALNGMIAELLDDDVSGYAAVGHTVVWVKTDGKKSSIYKVDAELEEQ